MKNIESEAEAFFFIAFAVAFGVVLSGLVAFVFSAIHINFWQTKKVPGQVPTSST